MTAQGSPPATLGDGFNRRISYLRLSVTDRCNLRCSYCMPAEGLPTVPRSQLLTREEIVLLATVALEIGIKKIRVTGGEPLVRPDIVELLEEIGALPGLERLVVTSNGFRLAELAPALKAAGVHGVNVSIDSLRPGRFAEITRGGDLAQCRAGMEAALAAGLRLKLNVVVMAGVNSDEVLDFTELAGDIPAEVRFIEYMPTQGDISDLSLILPSRQVLDTISTRYELVPLAEEQHPGPARRFRLGHGPGTVGVISAMSCQFCQDCNRIRVTAAGLARSCLFHEVGLDLKPLLQKGDQSAVAAALRQVVTMKPEAHDLGQEQRLAIPGSGPVDMSRLGG